MDLESFINMIVMIGIVTFLTMSCTSKDSKAQRDCEKKCHPHVCIGHAPNAIVCDMTKKIVE